MRDYSLVSPSGKRTKFWLKVKGDGAKSPANVTRPGREEEDDKGKRLEAYCLSLVEELEDEVYAGIMKGGFDSNGVEPELCQGIITPCPVVALASDNLAEAGEEGPDDGEAGEEGPDDGEAAPEAAPEDAVAAEAPASGGVERADGSRYIENMTIKMGPEGNFEL